MQKYHFIIAGNITDGLILDKDGAPYQPFKAFVRHMIQRNFATNTVKAYAEHVFRFLNYIYRAIELAPNPLDKHTLRELVYSYTSYLIHSTDSPNEIAREIATENCRTKKLAMSSLAPIDNAITYFIRLGEQMQYEEDLLLVEPLLKAVGSQRSPAEKKQMKEKSMLSGVLRGGLSNTQRVEYGMTTLQPVGKRPKQRKKYITRSLELALIADVIEAATNLRDKTFYSLLAASGCRSHEALQVKLEDIDLNSKEVFLRHPQEADRKNLGLTIEEEALLNWKGRETETTFLIEPFKSMFFEYLGQYIMRERVSTCGHTYLFQNIKTSRPHFCSDRSSRNKQFKNALKRAGVIDKRYLSPHSLRHSYGFYAINYIPVEEGVYGLPLAYVQELMGHSSIESTKIYANLDENITKEMVDHANNRMFKGSELTPTQIRIKFYENKCNAMKSKLEALYRMEEQSKCSTLLQS